MKKISKKNLAIIILSFFILVTFALPAAAEGTGQLKGFIYKKDGKTPLWGVQVLLKDTTTGAVFESNVTDAIGDYKLGDMPAGLYQALLLVKDRAYQIKKVDFLIRIFEGQTSTISFSLKKPAGFFPFLCKPCNVAAILAAIFAFIL